MYTPPQHVLYTSDGPFGFIGSLLAEMLALVTELGMQLNSERAALMFGCLLTCFLNIVLMAAVVVAVNDAEAEMLKLRLSATLFVISLLNCWWFLTSYRRYTVQAKFGYKREPLYLWTPPTISVCLWCGLSPPHVLALGLCDTTTWSTCAGSLSLVVMITCMLMKYLQMSREREDKLLAIYTGSFDELTRMSIQHAPTTSTYCTGVTQAKKSPGTRSQDTSSSNLSIIKGPGSTRTSTPIRATRSSLWDRAESRGDTHRLSASMSDCF